MLESGADRTLAIFNLSHNSGRIDDELYNKLLAGWLFK